MAWNRFRWRPYVPVARRRAQAEKKMTSLRKKGADIQPIVIEGRTIAKTFWGKAWCDHLESLSDYENRLPRGRTYVRNGSVCHLEINKGEILAKVAGSELYNLRIRIQTLPAKKWKAVKQRCAGQVSSLLELLQGKLSGHVMEVVTDRQDGMFPLSKEISLSCDCPDWAVMCKHVAAALYGVGARLDQQPELLFKLRGVDHEELIGASTEAAVSAATSRGRSRRLAGEDLSDVFGIDLDTSDDAAAASNPRKKSVKKVKKTKAVAIKKTTVVVKKTVRTKTTKLKLGQAIAKRSAEKKKTVPKVSMGVAAGRIASQEMKPKKAAKKTGSSQATRKSAAKSKG